MQLFCCSLTPTKEIEQADEADLRKPEIKSYDKRSNEHFLHAQRYLTEIPEEEGEFTTQRYKEEFNSKQFRGKLTSKSNFNTYKEDYLDISPISFVDEVADERKLLVKLQEDYQLLNSGVGVGSAKILLTGEHSVVYGKPAYCKALNIFTNCFFTISEQKDSESTIGSFDITFMNIFNDQPIEIKFSEDTNSFMSSAPENFNSQLIQRIVQSTELLPLIKQLVTLQKSIWLQLKIKSEHPKNCGGMGSSASAGVAITRSILLALEEIARNYEMDEFRKLSSKENIRKYADFFENLVHGKASGVDVFVSTEGKGIIEFIREVKMEAIAGIDEIQNSLVIVNSRVERQASMTIAKVREALERNPKETQAIIDQIGLISELIGQSIKENRRISQDLVRQNHRLLSDLQVSHPQLEKIVKLLEKFGFAGKLSGAGGGGCVLGFAAGRLEEMPQGLREEVEKQGFEVIYQEL